MAVMTMALTPFSAAPTYKLYLWYLRRQGIELESEQSCPSAEGRILVVGYNKVGTFVSEILLSLGHCPLVLDQDHSRCERARQNGMLAVCAEETSEEVLAKIELEKAALVLVTSLKPLVTETLARILKERSQTTSVMIATSEEEIRHLEELGVKQSIHAPFEVGLEFLHQALVGLKYEELEAHSIVDAVRHNHYAWTAEEIRRELDGLRMEWFDNKDGLEGSLAEFAVRKKTGASVVAVVRGDEIITDTGASFVVRPGDRIAAVGSHEQRERFRRWMRNARLVEEEGSVDRTL